MKMKARTRRAGFTLIEVLVVMAIVIFLAAMLIAALWPQKDKALRSKTSALIATVSNALDQYYAEFHDFPPDGYDTEPGWQKANAYIAGHAPGKPGIKLGIKGYVYYGSGCLIYFLCYPIANVTMIGADQGGFDPRNVRVSPCNKGSAFLTTLKVDDISVHSWDPNFDWAVFQRCGLRQERAGRLVAGRDHRRLRLPDPLRQGRGGRERRDPLPARRVLGRWRQHVPVRCDPLRSAVHGDVRRGSHKPARRHREQRVPERQRVSPGNERSEARRSARAGGPERRLLPRQPRPTEAAQPGRLRPLGAREVLGERDLGYHQLEMMPKLEVTGKGDWEVLCA